MRMRYWLTMALVSAVIGAAYAQEAPSPVQATAQQAAPAGTTTQAPARSAPAPAPTSSNSTSVPQTNAPAATPTATATTTPTGPSPDILKKARRSGYHIRVRQGTTYFCRSEATIGSRFVDEQCLNQDMFEARLERQQAQKDQLQQSMNLCATGGGACGGGK